MRPSPRSRRPITHRTRAGAALRVDGRPEMRRLGRLQRHLGESDRRLRLGSAGRLGGKTLLSEFPELHGVEQELINRCATDELAQRFYDLMQAYSARASAVHSGFEMNPSPGNIGDGLITDAIKSAGAARKGGVRDQSAMCSTFPSTHHAGTQPAVHAGQRRGVRDGAGGRGREPGAVHHWPRHAHRQSHCAGDQDFDQLRRSPERMGDIIDFDAGGIVTGETNIRGVRGEAAGALH